MKNKNNAMALLAAASATLIAPASQSAQVAQDFSFGVRHHQYEEDNLPESLGGSKDRYDIDVNQFSLIAPVNDNFDIAASYQFEKMSGASPWYTIKDAANKTVQIMSGASIKDERTDVSVTGRYITGKKSFAITGATSDEDDYKSHSFGAKYTVESSDRANTFAIAADFSNDKINAVDSEVYTTRPSDEKSKHSASLLLSYSRVIDKNSLLSVSLGYSDKSGYLSDPYKMVLTDFQLVADSRPGNRVAKTISTQYRYFLDSANAALHFDYRFYDDDWQITSHTINLAWYQNLAYGFQLVPSIRIYSQSDSYFYESYYDSSRSDGYYSTDYRLSEYGAYTYGLKVNKQLSNWKITISAEQYSSAGDYGFADTNDENPALLDFTLVSVGFDVTF